MQLGALLPPQTPRQGHQTQAFAAAKVLAVLTHFILRHSALFYLPASSPSLGKFCPSLQPNHIPVSNLSKLSPRKSPASEHTWLQLPRGAPPTPAPGPSSERCLRTSVATSAQLQLIKAIWLTFHHVRSGNSMCPRLGPFCLQVLLLAGVRTAPRAAPSSLPRRSARGERSRRLLPGAVQRPASNYGGEGFARAN